MRFNRLTAALVTTLLMVTPVAAQADSPPPETVYLSLGTSLAAGSLADSNGDTTFSSESSYTDQLYQRMKGRIGANLVHEKLGCDGETTDQFMGGLNVSGQPSKCAGRYETGSQLGDALAAVGEGNVVLITIDIGANDVLQAQQVCQGDPSCIVGEIPMIAGKVAQLMGALRQAGYAGPIVAMNYYNPQVASAIGYFSGVAGQQTPNPTLAQLSDQLAQGFNGALTQAYAATGVEVADVYAAFNAGDFGDDKPPNGIPDNVDALCDLSYMCPDDPAVKANIHLTSKGYKVVAKTILAVVDDIEFTS
jgi:lysophospholipase L1-like esterase